MRRVVVAWAFRAFVFAAALTGVPSTTYAANYTWKTLSGTGNWTDSVNWSGTSATNLYPGSVGSGTADAAFVQAIYTSSPTINLDTSVTVRQLNLGGTTGATTFPVTLSTNNASTITLAQTTGTAILAVNSAVNSGTNLLTPSILLSATTLQINMASVTSGTLNLAVAGDVSAGSAGTKIIRYTPNNTSTTTDPSFIDFRGNITNGSGTVSFFYRNDMPNSVNTMRLSGTGNTFTGGLNFSGGKPGQAILESSPASGTNGALGTGALTLGASGSSATLNLGGSLSTVTEVCGINVAGTVAKRIAVIGAGDRILSGSVNQTATAGLTLACSAAGNLTLTKIGGTGPITISSTGSGTVIFSGSNSYTGTATVSQGTLQLAHTDALSKSAVTVAAGSTLSVGPQVAAVVPTLVNNGLVNVGLGGLTVKSGQTAGGILAAIIAGRDNGTWSGTSGITSSAAASQSERAVGWLNNGDGSFTVAFGAAGDWNLNGVVDFDDVVQFLSANLYDTGLPATWADGDYDYNGVVDFDDVVASVSANLFDAGPYNTAPGGLSALRFGDGLAGGGIAAVPEPTTFGLAAMASGTLLWLARRRQPHR